MQEITLEIPKELTETLQRARRVAVLTGAGVSAESGVPTFRDAQAGLWAQYDPQTLATREGFSRDPRLVWEWYASRRATVARVEPNPGHFALAELERRVPDFTLITQNVDGLHRRAGSRNVLELHGNINRTKCFREDKVVDEWLDDGSVPPRCPRCRGYLRPDVVWFGEPLPHAELQAAIQAARSCDIFFSVGTSTEVEPAASLPFEALARGRTVVEVNPDPTPLSSRATFRLIAPSGQVLPLLLQQTWGEERH